MDEVLSPYNDYDVVKSVLSGLSRDEVVSLGKTLGLGEETLKAMTDIPGDMVEAWLKMKDDVFSESGEPTWTTLSDALKSINQTSLADKIIESGGVPQAMDIDTNHGKSSDHVAQAGEGDEKRTESDVWPFSKKNKDDTVKQDSAPASSDSSVNRLEDDYGWPFKAKEKVHWSTKDRGTHVAQLRLDDSDTDITELTPEKSSVQPFSRRGFYPMKSKRHGIALIINNKEFESDSHKTRRGTDRDELNLCETWQFLGYHVVILRNSSRDEMARTFKEIDKPLKKAARSEGVANDSFVCCILSHGHEGEVFGSDSRPLEHNRILRYLATSEILRSKPKLLFIQACQGNSPGTKAMTDYLQDVGADDDSISEYTDFYLSCASVFGDRSYRDIYTGTWFISELCQTLCKLGTVMDLDEIQKEVNERVVKNYTHLGYKQQPRGIDQLRRKVFFFQRETEHDKN